MRLSLRTLAIGTLVLGFAVPASAQEKSTIWSFLGIPQGYRKVHGAMFNRRGNFPGLEKKPPLKPIADAANLESDNPLLKNAAKIKQAEDLKKQKIKAVKYLATIGCGCYNKNGEVTEALMAGLNDCTPEVRLATVNAIAEAAQDGACGSCSEKSCCTEELTKKLADLAYERNDEGCWLEPSEEVREAAKQALRICCPGRGPIVEEYIDPVDPVDPTDPGIDPDAPPLPPQTAFKSAAARSSDGTNRLTAFVGDDALIAPAPAPSIAPKSLSQGAVVLLDTKHNRAHVKLPGMTDLLPLGMKFRVFEKQAGKLNFIGNLEVVRAYEGAADVVPLGSLQVTQIGRGSVVVPE